MTTYPEPVREIPVTRADIDALVSAAADLVAGAVTWSGGVLVCAYCGRLPGEEHGTYRGKPCPVGRAAAVLAKVRG